MSTVVKGGSACSISVGYPSATARYPDGRLNVYPSLHFGYNTALRRPGN